MFKQDFLQLFKRKATRFLIIWLQISIFFFILYSLSLIVYYIMYTRMTPNPIVRQPVYFDFSLDQPKAILSLTMMEKQWVNYKVKQILGVGLRPLKSGAFYDIEAIVTLSKSPRNLDLGKVALTTTIIDNTAEAIAKSIRPVVIPYFTDTYLFLETVFTFPTRFFGFHPEVDSSKVFIPIFKDYQEPYFNFPPSEIVELMLSNDYIDVIDMELVVIPHLSWLSYFLFHYPRLSFMVGFSIVSAAEGGLYLLANLVGFVLVIVLSEEKEQEIKEEIGMDAMFDEETFNEMKREVENVIRGRSPTASPNISSRDELLLRDSPRSRRLSAEDEALIRDAALDEDSLAFYEASQDHPNESKREREEEEEID